MTYGLAEFVAAEEMGRTDGYWWSPDGGQLLAARVDTSRVGRRYIADPANPGTPPVEMAYPAAGTENAEVTLHLLDVVTSGGRVEVEWDRAGFEYVTQATWSEHGLLVVVQSRDQRRMQLLAVDVSTGATSVVREDRDDDWVDIVDGVPARLKDGSIVWTLDCGVARRLAVGDETVTPDGLQIREVLGVDGNVVLFAASTEPTEVGVWTWSRAEGLVTAHEGAQPGVAAAWRRGGTTVIAERRLDAAGVQVTVQQHGREVARIASVADTPVITPHPLMRRAGERELRTAVLFPGDYELGSGQLPVLLDPYGGPHFQAVMAASGAFLGAQWFADQGFCVVIADGRGTPGRGPVWDRAVHGDIASLALKDQVAALHAVAEEFGDLDLGRVAIRGWSFGGYLAALAVLRRPDVFHAAVAGAPVTEWRLYDTHYTERYLGHPSECPENYRADVAAGGRRQAAPAAPPHPRPRRRQRGGGQHLAVVLCASGSRTPAFGPPPVGGDAHDTSGGRGGEPPLTAARIHPERPCSTGRAGGVMTVTEKSRQNRFARTLFSGLPGRYDRLAEVLSMGQNGRWRREMVGHVIADSPPRILDVASGTAGVALQLARRSGGRVVGLDLTKAMLWQGAENVAAAGETKRIQLVLGRGEQLPFPDASFDALSFTYLLRYVQDPAATLAELARVVKPGGAIASLEFLVPPNPIWHALWICYTAPGASRRRLPHRR